MAQLYKRIYGLIARCMQHSILQKVIPAHIVPNPLHASWPDVNKRHAYLCSGDQMERLGGVLAMDELIDVKVRLVMLLMCGL